MVLPTRRMRPCSPSRWASGGRRDRLGLPAQRAGGGDDALLTRRAELSPERSPWSCRSTTARPRSAARRAARRGARARTRQYELILVNDGSRDGSWEPIEPLAARAAVDPRHRPDAQLRAAQRAPLRHPRRASRAIVVTMDDDLQHPPEEIPKLLADARARATTSSTARRAGAARVLARRSRRRSPSSRCRSAMGAETARQGQRVPRVPHGAARRVRATTAGRSCRSTCC